MSRKNQVVVTSQATVRKQLVSRIITDNKGKVTGKWNGQKVVLVESNVWNVIE